MNWFDVLLSLLGIIFGGGVTWLFTVNSMKKKADGEATQSQAEGWKSMQDVYQQTIEDMKGYSEDIRRDRDILRGERNELRKENDEMRKKYVEMEDTINDLKNAIAEQGRKIELLSPFLCGIAGCLKRKKVTIEEADDDDVDENNKEND